MYGYNRKKPAYKAETGLSNGTDMESKTYKPSTSGSIKSLSADITQVKAMLYEVRDLSRDASERIDSLSRVLRSNRSSKVVQVRTTNDEEGRLCRSEKESKHIMAGLYEKRFEDNDRDSGSTPAFDKNIVETDEEAIDRCRNFRHPTANPEEGD